MSNPQQPELRRSAETTSLNPDAIEGELDARKRPGRSGDVGEVPEANQPGSGSGPEQDKPDLDAFAAKLGVDADATPDPEREDAPAASSGGRSLPRPVALAIGTASIAAGAAWMVARPVVRPAVARARKALGV